MGSHGSTRALTNRGRTGAGGVAAAECNSERRGHTPEHKIHHLERFVEPPVLPVAMQHEAAVLCERRRSLIFKTDGKERAVDEIDRVFVDGVLP